MNKISAIFKLLRPKQYAKNLFIFLTAFFGGAILNPGILLNLSLGFMLFSLASSAVYIFNDILDVESDRLHPTKKNRPIASGLISVSTAGLLCAFLILVTLPISWFFLSPITTYLLTTYLLLNTAYCMRLKHIAIIDVILIALGFVLRVFFGATISNIEPSSWLILMTFLLSLFLGFAKRRDDVIIFEKSGKKMRSSIDGYNKAMIETLLSITSTILVLCYIMYTQSAESLALVGVDTHYLYTTSIFVIIGIFRYIQLTLVRSKSGSPTQVLFTDPMIQTALAGWIISFGGIIYFL